MKHTPWLLATLFCLGISQAEAAPPVHHYEYDANGNSTKTTDGLSHSTIQQYDRLDRPVLIQQPHPSAAGQLGTIQTQYNSIDEVVNVTDPRALPTTYTKNAFGEIISQTSPDTGTTSFTYDNAGNMLTRTDARGAVANYTYDGASRTTSASYKPSAVAAADETVQFVYDTGTPYGNGRLGQINDASGYSIFEYDAQGRAWYKRQVVNGNYLDYLYVRDNNSGRLVYYAFAANQDANLLTYEHNENAQINKISVNGQVIVQNVLYYPDGSVESWQWGNGQSYYRINDTSGRVVRYTLGDKLQNIVYDNGGRIQQTYRAMLATPNTPIIYSTSTYAYDNLDRITNHVIDTANPTNSTGYAYDLSGNRTNLNLGANNYPSTIASTSNRLTADTGSINRTYTYDGTGNITGDGQDSYSYYASGRLKQITRGGSVLAQFKYNGMGELVKKTNSSNQATYYLYDTEHHLIGEYNQNGQPIQSYIYLGDIPVAVLKGGSGNVQDKLFYVYTDHLNTPREIRNHANQQRWTWYPEQSGAFGNGQPNDNPASLGAFTFNLRFPGQLYDVASGLSYNYYRDYNSRTGRYIESDPIGLAGGINTYGYVGGNPLSRIDPDGRFFFLPFIAGLAGGGSGAGATAATLGALGVGAAVTWGLQHPAKPSGSASSDPFANSGADAGSSSSSASDSGKSCKPNHDDECEQHHKEDEAACAVPIIRYGYVRGSACLRSAMTRYSECLRFGVGGITTPLHGVDTPL